MSPGHVRGGRPHLHLGVHVPVDGRQPVDGGQAATSPGTSMEHPLLVLVEGSQMGVMSRRLQLVSANTQVHGETGCGHSSFTLQPHSLPQQLPRLGAKPQIN